MVIDSLLCKYKACKSHAEQVRLLSLMIFDKTKEIGLQDLSDNKRNMLEIGAGLHDIGYFVEPKGHNKHSSELIKKESFLEVDENEKNVIACIARYHRGSLPKQSHSTYGSLSDKKQKTVRKLAGIVRLADGLDSSHRCLVKDLEFKYCAKHKILWMKIIPQHSDAKMDLVSAIRKKDLFEKAFGLQLVLVNI